MLNPNILKNKFFENYPHHLAINDSKKTDFMLLQTSLKLQIFYTHIRTNWSVILNVSL